MPSKIHFGNSIGWKATRRSESAELSSKTSGILIIYIEETKIKTFYTLGEEDVPEKKRTFTLLKKPSVTLKTEL